MTTPTSRSPTGPLSADTCTTETETLTDAAIQAPLSWHARWTRPPASSTTALDTDDSDGVCCGNGSVDGGEACDGADLGALASDACADYDATYDAGTLACSATCTLDLTDCVVVICGDGIVAGDEECDDANDTAGDGCTSCAEDAGFVCAFDAMEGRSVCSEAPSCGDGVLASTEGCEDRNTSSGDGCSDSCEAEDGWSCTLDDLDVIDSCDPVLGDGLVVGDEACDDGNETAGDGCSDGAVEDGFVCDDAEPSRLRSVRSVRRRRVDGWGGLRRRQLDRRRRLLFCLRHRRRLRLRCRRADGVRCRR